MAVAPDSMIFQFVGGTIDNATNKFIVPAAENLIDAITPVALSGVTLYIVLIGYGVMSGSVQEPFWSFFKNSVKISFIIGIALSFDLYVEYVVDTLNGLESGLASAFNADVVDGASIYEVLDDSLNKSEELIAICDQKADEAGFNIGTVLGWWVSGWLISIGAFFFTVIGAAILITSKFFLAALFALGPFFIMLLLFPVTARFFDGWFGQVINYILTIVLLTVVVNFTVTAYNGFIKDVDLLGSDASPSFISLEIFCLTGVMVFLIYQTHKIAASLAGGLAMEAMTLRQMAMPITSPASGARAVNNAVNPVSTKPDMQTGRLESHSRLGHLIRGNTKLSPAYRQYVGKTWGRNWGKAKGGKVDNNS